MPHPRPALAVLLLLMPVLGHGHDARTSCITVEVEGERIPSYECLSQRMAPARSSPERPAPHLDSERMVMQGSQALGLFNQSATRIRMGNAFGHGVTPQRPAPAPHSPPLR